MRFELSADPRIRARGEDLLSTPVVVRVSDIDEDGAAAFTKDMDRAHGTGQPLIPIVIDSFGGDAYSLLTMVAQIKAARVPVITIVEGKAMSAGALLFGYGARRFMAERAVLMLHDVATHTAEGKAHEAIADASETTRLQESMFRELARNCGKPDGYFLTCLDDRKHAEWYLTAKDARKHGLIDAIGVPKLTTRVAVIDGAAGPDGRDLLTDGHNSRNVTETTRRRAR